MNFSRTPKRKTRKSGWVIVGRARSRDYYAIVSPFDEPRGTYRTQALALAAVQRHERFQLLEAGNHK